MSTLKIRIPGEPKKLSPDDTKAENTDLLAIDEIYFIHRVIRGDTVLSKPVELNEDKVVEFSYSDGTVWLGDYSTIDDIFPGTTAQVRSVESGTSDAIDIPIELVGFNRCENFHEKGGYENGSVAIGS
jgi:hypothetical protein